MFQSIAGYSILLNKAKIKLYLPMANGMFGEKTKIV